MPDKPLKIYLSDRAKADFKSIQQYTLEQHGKKQVLRYSSLIKEHLDKLSFNPAIGHTRVDIPEEYRAWLVGQHLVIYRFDTDAIYVVAILHGRMNVTNQLGDRLNS